MTLPADSQKLQQQATDYETVIQACKSVQACVGVTIWDFTDKVSPLRISTSRGIIDPFPSILGYQIPSLAKGLRVLGTRYVQEAVE